jgi:hypothetical protein
VINVLSPRDIFNMLKWKEGESLSEAEVYYVHRGAPGDQKAVSGSDIISIGPFCFEINTGACIPYHRIFKIFYRGKAIFERYRH